MDDGSCVKHQQLHHHLHHQQHLLRHGAGSGAPAGSGGVAKLKKPKKKKKRDPHEPQKPVSAYAMFFRDTQSKIKAKKPDASFGEISKLVASMWDNLDQEDKNDYKKRTETAKKEYLRKLAAYKARMVSMAMQQHQQQMHQAMMYYPNPVASPTDTGAGMMAASSPASTIMHHQQQQQQQGLATPTGIGGTTWCQPLKKADDAYPAPVGGEDGGGAAQL
uniref:HMG box domain-containing protein n=1 Tax=Macrostomum lignano TaxID=282301 RepID=A0A1I8IXV1_9PLAT